ncbi:CusA/CzcA family heavy metal efflux RND transporter [Hymenobacter ginsengisoli]|uniref:CusA/CzcA family heavy metal efflux RND transporter n=1 Tax=Hymenobacter ginsengisoli TaxID=1051626 RepID=A0ABP8Q6P1_9BACT|nr:MULTISPECIES: CusA/CzcA family heavy metal efflux RND transporter [unclassified Hymenobacter]MBO2031775.1 efflux RND transporter permease subunit [Hymenobacter sp. BT559]
MNKFIKGVIGFSLRHPFVVFFITALVVVAGAVSFYFTPVEAYPDVTNTEVVIITQWPGRSAEEVERFISIPIETEMNSISRKTVIRSINLFGLSFIKIVFEDGTDNFNARMEAAQKLANVNLPDGVAPEVQPPTGPTGEIYRFTLTSKIKSATELKTLEDWVIEKNLKAVPGVGDVVSFGGKVKTYEVAVTPPLLTKYGLTALDVFQALQRANVNVGGDIVREGQQAFVVRGIGIVKNVADIEKIIIKNVNGVPVLVRNIANVHTSNLPQLGIVGRDDHDDVVEGIVLMRKGENPGAVLPLLEAKVDYLNTTVLPSDVKIKVFYDRTELNEHTLHTVGENVIMGITLVTIVLLIFLADWRTTVTVAMVIPLALLFAFILMRWKGMTANLLSIGAIDFGIIIDGAVVMVEGLFVMLAHWAEHEGMESFNKRAKLSKILHTGTEMGKSIFTSKLIIVTALIPIFSFQKVEGKLFSPLAYTLGFALLGALLLALTLVPVLSSILLKKNVRERHNPLIEFLNRNYAPLLDTVMGHPRRAMGGALVALLLGIGAFHFVGTEFLPHLNEGSIYVRASMPLSISLEDSYHFTKQFRQDFEQFPEVRGVISQTGRPNDGTDATGFFNNEFFVDLYPADQWKRKITKEQLIAEMQAKLAHYRGIDFNFSQPISDNVEEAVSGVKGSMAVKITGDDLNFLDKKADEVYALLKKVKGVEDLGVFRNLGQPELHITLDPDKMAQFGVDAADANAVIEMAIGGKAVSQVFEGERKFDLRLRYDQPYRSTPDQIGNLLVPNLNGGKVKLQEIATIGNVSGPAFIYRENNSRFIAIKFSVRGRDMGSTIAEAQALVKKNVALPKGYAAQWNGEFENQERAQRQLSIVVPISILAIFFILFISFGNALDSVLVLLNVPFALIGGIAALLLTGVNFSISAGVGFIALFGVATQDGVILVNKFRQNMREGMPLVQAIKDGARSRLRPVVMTALMASLGLLPAAVSHGIGSETQKPLAIVVIGGLITATLLSLLILPAVYEWVYSSRQERERHR